MSDRKETLSIELKMTDQCNQECFHCANRDGLKQGRRLNWKLFNQKLEEWAQEKESSVYELKEIRLTGGEPLMDFDAVLGIVECCSRLGIKSGINTNGLLLNSGRIRALKEFGVEVMKISFDAVDTGIHGQMRGPLASIQPILRIVKSLVDNRFKVILRFTLSRLNRDQLSPCYAVAKKMGVHKFQIKPLIPAGRALDSNFFLNKEEVDESLLRLGGAYSRGSTPIEVLCWPPAKNSEFFYKHCGSIDKIYVSPGLGTSICNYIWDEGLFGIGNLSDLPLDTILRRRHNKTWSAEINGFHLIKGCPNAGFFASRRT